MMDEGELLRLFRQVVSETHGPSKFSTLTLEAAAREAGVSPRRLRLMVRAGRVLAKRDGRGVTIPRSELKRIKPSMGGPSGGRPPVPRKRRAQLKAASLKRQNTR